MVSGVQIPGFFLLEVGIVSSLCRVFFQAPDGRSQLPQAQRSVVIAIARLAGRVAGRAIVTSDNREDENEGDEDHPSGTAHH